jgi:GH15 family glucan-1,4-alpha-glucosidase
MKENDQKRGQDPYPPIEDYAYISDCHSSALISKAGSIDWCCMPRLDSSSCFARLLGWENGGYCQIVPKSKYSIKRKYLENTLILETTFETDSGSARLTDFFTMRRGGEHNPHRQILRIIEGLEGQVELEVVFRPRFDYGAIRPWIRQINERTFAAMGGSDGLLLTGDIELSLDGRHHCGGSFTINSDEKRHISIIYHPPEELDEQLSKISNIDELDRRFEETHEWWKRWVNKGNFKGKYKERALRSAIILKGLSNAPTGAIAASPTTSLPESMGGNRNWDYRFTWIRDSAFTVRSLAELGYDKEADGFRRFIERSAAGSAEELQILYGVGGERRLFEKEIEELEGYRGSKPVRMGNAAVSQLQFDIFGELLDLSWHWHRRGNSPDDDYWEFIVELINRTIALWQKPDRGIWEIRGEPRHFVLSKAMCWVALDRGIKMACDLKHDCPVKEWEKERDAICKLVEDKGYDKKRGVFIQAFDNPIMDASLLLLPIFGFVDYTDERMIRTTDAIREDLDENGLIRRYASGSDSLSGDEGVFITCTFWLAQCLAKQGRLEDANKYFERASSTANDLGLFSEEYDTKKNQMLGNFPQGLTHLSYIFAINTLEECSKNKK